MSNNRNLGNIATAITNATTGQVLTSQGSGVATFSDAGGGVTYYANVSDLPASGNSNGDAAFVGANNRLYIFNGAGWYSVALLNQTPTFSSIQDASSGTTPFTLSTDGTTATVITVNATDAEGEALTYNYSVSSGALNGSTISQNNNVFTVTPHASNAATFNITFTASDGINTATSAAQEFTLRFEPVWTTGSQQAKIQPSDIAAQDNFGSDVSLSPDGNTAVIGSPYDSTYTGAVYVFTRSGSTWTQHSKLVANDAAQDSYFGRSVSLSGNGNYLIVGSAYTDTSYTNDGSAYIFVRDTSNNTWSQQSKLLASNAEASDYFGSQVTMNFDGTYAAIGVPSEDTGGTSAGSVYIFARSGSSWSQQAILQSSDVAVNELFGISIDINSDASYLIAGSRAAVSGLTNAGAAYIFTRSGSTWTQQAKLVASDPIANGGFAYNVRINSDATIAAMRSVSNGEGAVYIFTRSGSSWSQEAKITVSASLTNFGFDIALSDDGVFLLAGARLDDTTADNAGAAYVFKRSGTSWTQQIKLQSSDAEANDLFGSIVALSGDGSTAIMGVVNEDTGYTNAGSAYVFEAS